LLTINKSQLLVLTRDEGYEDFVGQMIDHLRKHFPRKVAEFDDMGLAEQIHECLMRASDYGLVEHGECARYLGLAASLGWSFDTDVEWIHQLLSTRICGPSERLAQVHHRVIRQLRRGA